MEEPNGAGHEVPPGETPPRNEDGSRSQTPAEENAADGKQRTPAPSEAEHVREMHALNAELLETHRLYTNATILACQFLFILPMIGVLLNYWTRKNLNGSHTTCLILGGVAAGIAVLLFIKTLHTIRSCRKKGEEISLRQDELLSGYRYLLFPEDLPERVVWRLIAPKLRLPVLLSLLLTAAIGALCLVSYRVVEDAEEQKVYDSYVSGVELYNAGDYRQAQDAISYAAARDYSNAGEFQALGRAGELKSRRNYDGALEILLDLQDTADSEEIRREAERCLQQIARTCFNAGIENLNQKQYRAAESCFSSAARADYGDAGAYELYSSALEYRKNRRYLSAKSKAEAGIRASRSTQAQHYGTQLLSGIESDLTAWKQAHPGLSGELAAEVPYVGMSEQDISNTMLGYPSTVQHSQETVSGKSVTANNYDFVSNGRVVFSARCVQGKVTKVWDTRSSPYKQSGGSSKSGSSKSSGTSRKKSDPYDASSYAHPEDFYDWYYDDFWDYEDAEDYWEEYN